MNITSWYTYPNERKISEFIPKWVTDTYFPFTVTHDNGCVRVAKTDWSHSSLRISQLWYLEFCCDSDKQNNIGKAIKWCLVVICQLPRRLALVLLLNCFVENNTSQITERGRKPHKPPCPLCEAAYSLWNTTLLLYFTQLYRVLNYEYPILQGIVSGYKI